MKRYQFTYTLLLLALIGCSTKNDSIEMIGKLEQELYSNTEKVFDRQSADKLVAHYESFVEANPDDTLCASYLFKGGEVSMGMGSSEKAIELYNRVYKEYPDYRKAATALFLIGFVNETQVRNLAKAQKHYRKFIADFPDHNLIDDAKFSLDNLGKSDEDIIKEFEAKLAKTNQKDSL
ncbi:MAG: tetratricopeptide repeat protein [Flavobacteriales bacterium]|nr:tetratricopeptide repeat protein [Flavobacteriales bacterium]